MTDLCIMSPSVLVPALRSILGELALNDPDRRLKYYKDEGIVAVPVKSGDTADNIKDAFRGRINMNELEIKSVNLPKAKRLNVKSPRIIMRERLKKLVIESGHEWSTDVSEDIPAHWEIHGDLVIISDSVFILPIWNIIGQDVWRAVVDSLSCERLARKSKISIDGYRTPQVHLLLGNDGWVEHTDNNIRYTYDVTKCMFSIGNITEKLRVANFNCQDEIVVDLYAGIGYFTLPYLVHTGVKHLHACEWNLDAVEALHRNLVMNRVRDRCTVYAGDNREMCPKGIADRVNLGLIPSSREGWTVACAALKPGTGGMLHIHYNVNTKPRTGNQTEINQENREPTEVFRCEGKCENSRTTEYENSRTDKCENSRTTECENSRTDKCENSRTTECENSRTNECKNSRTDKCENSSTAGRVSLKTKHNDIHSNVEVSKWYPWAKETSDEIQDILHDIHKSEWRTIMVHIEHVKSYAPYVDHVVLDLECRPRYYYV